MLGTREPDIYGHDTLADIEARCRAITDEAGHQLHWMQSNSEGDLITTIQQANGVVMGFGAMSYIMAVRGVVEIARETKTHG